MDYFERCRAFVGIAEGGRNFKIINGRPVLNPGARMDRGGLTAYGITEGTLRDAHSAGIVGHGDITRLSRDEATEIYRIMYWVGSRSDRMEFPLCLAHFDTAVNCGVVSAGKILQRAIRELGGSVGIDGIVGPETMGAIQKLDIHRLTASQCQMRAAFYRGLVAKNEGQGVFLKNWLQRTASVAREAGVEYAG